jgi:hypothetical protein
MANLKTLVTRARVEGLVILLAALVYLREAKKIPDPFHTEGVPGPAVFPEVLGVVLALGGLWLLLMGRRGAPAAGGETAQDGGDRGQPAPRSSVLWSVIAGNWRFYTVWGIVLAYLFFMPILGFVVATFPAMAGLFILLGAKRWPAVWIGAVSTAAIHLCFAVGLHVQLPLGILQSLVK